MTEETGGAARAVDALGRVNGAVGEAGRRAAAALLGFMMAAVILQVVARYALNNSLSWTEEFSKTLMVWSAFLVAPWAYRTGANVSIDMFAEALPGAAQRVLDAAITVLVLWIVGVLFIESFAFIERGMTIGAAALPVRVGWFYLIVPVSLGSLFLVGLERLARLALGAMR
ncbi:MAG: TRAP transporter small permease [Parvularculaceae bacterium]